MVIHPLKILFRSLLVLSCLVISSYAQVPAFPDAEGYGAYATGGRNGDVYIVTNLNASGEGSFYHGITTIPPQGRTIVFAVSGSIRLASGNNTRVTGSKLTIAGQTAPGDGILFTNGSIRFSGDDIIIRHLRFRHGKQGSGGDCINLDAGCHRAIMDHISVSFSTDENISSFRSAPDNVTLQWALNAWGLQPHSCGGLWDQNYASCHHTLWAHNHTRNPKARPGGLLEWTNNVTFDWGIGFIMGDSQTPASWKANVIGNYFICPPGNIRNNILEKGRLDRHGKPNFSIHLSDNLHDRDGDGILNGIDRGWDAVHGTPYDQNTNPGGNYYKLDTPVPGSGRLNIDSPLLAYKKIISDSGALRLDYNYEGGLRDAVDARLLDNLVNQRRNQITRESDLQGISNGGFDTFSPATPLIDSDKDGMPDDYEIALGWNPAVQDHNVIVSGESFFPAGYDGMYTRLEEYLQFKSMPHMMLPKNITSPDIDLTRYTSGFSNNPVFTIANITGGTATQSGTGNKFVHFTADNQAGRGGFDFTVTDAEGSTWTRRFAICVTNNEPPVDLDWSGAQSNVWDSSSNNWLKSGTPASFSHGDRVTFDDVGAATPNVHLPASVLAATMDINSTSNYHISGPGTISTSNALTKRGSGTFTLANTGENQFAAISLESGTLALNEANAAGTSKISFNGGSLLLAPPTHHTVPNPLEFNAPAEITVGSQHFSGGNWSGNQVVTLNATSSQLWSVGGSWDNFTGVLKIGTGNPRIRLNGNYNTNFGSHAVTVDLGAGGGQLMNRNGATIAIGELTSTSSSTVLSGTQTGTAESTYEIGGKNTNSTFAGSIVNGGGSTHIHKIGHGTWTLSGNSTHSGNTTVSAGSLLVDGVVENSPITVASDAMLGGSGVIGSGVTANAGAILSPGTIPFTGEILQINGGLTLRGNTLYYDMSNSPAGNNDKIEVGGTLALSGSQYFQFLLLDGPLSPGTYDLIHAANSSASGVSLTHNLPTDSRQSFSLGRNAAGTQPSKVWLTVSGAPASLTWSGNSNNVWDTTATNNWNGAAPNTFFNHDLVLFDDTATTRDVTLSGEVAPFQTRIDTELGYTIQGAGALIGPGSLTKTGSGSLTISNTEANSFHGGTTLEQGTIILSNSQANESGLGTGPITILDGTLTMAGYHGSSSNSYAPMPNDIIVPAGSTATLQLTQRAFKPGAANIFPAITGSLFGAGTLNLQTRFLRGDVVGNWSAFEGTLQVTTDSYGDFRFGTSYSWPGMPLASVILGDNVGALFVGTSNSGAGTTVEFGELAGSPSSTLLGGTTNGRNFIYRIGAKTPAGQDTIFAGTIAEQSEGVFSSYVKAGAGSWTLAGTGSWNGDTTVEAGTLRITGEIECAGGTHIENNAILHLDNGMFSTEAANVQHGGLLKGHGTIEGELNIAGTLETNGITSGTSGELIVNGDAYFESQSVLRMHVGSSSDHLSVDGDVSLEGTIQIQLEPGMNFGRIQLMACTGEISGLPTLEVSPSHTQAHLSITPEGLDLVIDDSDEDDLPDSWEMAYFGNLDQSAEDDFDGDNLSNFGEYLLNLDPTDANSDFRISLSGNTLTWPSAPGLTFKVKRSLTLKPGDWETIATVVGTSGSTTSFTDTATFQRAFYRIELTY